MNQNVHIGVKFITEPQNREAWRAGVPPRAPPPGFPKGSEAPPPTRKQEILAVLRIGVSRELRPPDRGDL